MKEHITIAALVKNIFTGKSNNDNTKFTIKKKKWIPNKGIYLDCLTKHTLQAKYVIKNILASSFWSHRYGAPIKLIPK